MVPRPDHAAVLTRGCALTVESDINRGQYATNGTTGPWTVPFYFLENSHVRVTYTDSLGDPADLTLDVDYSIAGVGDPDGGTVTTTVAYAAGGYITVLRNVPILQETAYPEAGKFPASAHERALDLLTMIVQQQAEVIARALVFSASDPTGATLPPAAARANTQVLFGASGELILAAPVSGSAADVLLQLADKSLSARNAGLVGFDGQLNYVARTVGSELGLFEVNPRWFAAANGYVFGDGVVDDFAAIQAAVNWIPSTGGGVLKFPRNCTARTSAQIVASNRKIIIDLQMSSLTLTANATSLLDLVGDTITVRNGYLLKGAAVTAKCITGRNGIGHRYENLISWDQKWTKVFHLTGVNSSDFVNNHIQNDIAGLTGNIFELDYCVNNAIRGGFYAYCAQAFYATSVANPVGGHYSEGLTLTDVRTYKAVKAVNCDNITQLTIAPGCILDFCGTNGVFATNGNTLTVAEGVWIAGDTTNGFVGVGTGATFEGAVVGACTITRGATAILGTVGVSLSGPRASVNGTRFAGGMNGGTVTDPTSSVVGPKYQGGGTLITTPNGNAGPAESSGSGALAINFGGAAVGVTYTTNAYTYTKVGNEMVLRWRCTLSSKGVSVGAFQVSGFPFTNNGTYRGSALVLDQTNMATKASPVGQVQLAAGTAVFFNMAATALIDNTYFNNNSTFDCEFRLQVA